MSYEDGWAAVNLQAPPRVPRTEYSAHQHWSLVQAVTGIEVGPNSAPDEQHRAGQAFLKAWNYDFMWSTTISRGVFGDLYTDMGHAEFAAGGVDKRESKESPFQTPEDVLNFDPMEAFGPLDRAATARFFEEQFEVQKQTWPTALPMAGIYVSMVSGLIDLFGWDLMLLAAGTDPQRFGELANRYSRWIQQYFDALADADVPMVMIHDDLVWTSGPFIHPDWYRQYIFPNLKRQIAPVAESGKRVAFTSDGDFSLFIDDVAGLGVHGFVMEPCTDMARIAETYGQSHFFIGNADVRVLMTGDREKIRAEVQRCMDIGKDCPGFFLAVGNHIPANTPVDACLYYNEVYEELARR
jgi:uroporphyrinogen-III decarboxylase